VTNQRHSLTHIFIVWDPINLSVNKNLLKVFGGLVWIVLEVDAKIGLNCSSWVRSKWPVTENGRDKGSWQQHLPHHDPGKERGKVV
jgi:hypothetical protein